MKSYVKNLVDYREIPFGEEIDVSCPDEYIKSQMKHLTRSGKKTVQADILEKGDVAVLSLESGIEKFNRPDIILTVGSGLFDGDFEEMLTGHKTGETFEVNIDGNTVKVNIKQANRTIFPEPTDEMVEKYAKEHEDFEGVKTVEEYAQRVSDMYVEQQKDEAVFDKMYGIMNGVIEGSDFVIDGAELDEILAEDMKYIEMDLQDEYGVSSIDSLTEKQLEEWFEVSTPEDLNNELRENTKQRIQSALWRAAANGADAKAMTCDEIDEKFNWDFLENYVRDNICFREVK